MPIGLEPGYPRFITRRLLRTIPAYLVVLALYFPVLVFPVVVAGLALRPSATKVVASIAAVLLFGVCIRGYLVFHAVQELAGAVLAALVVGSALYWSVERPFLRLRDRLTVSPAPRARDSAQTSVIP